MHRVKEFHDKFGLPDGSENVLLDNKELQQFRLAFLREEIDELETALAERDLVGIFDALLDLVYVAYGTALCAGINPEQFDAGMDAVHAANMAKCRAESADQSKRGTTFDVVKPDGWQGPEIKLAKILLYRLVNEAKEQ